MAAIVGAAGLRPCLAAARAGKRLLLANKEALVVGGALFMRAVQEGGATLLPIDSEHSAIFQCLPQQRSQWPDTIEHIVLTASGGPFRSRDPATLHAVTPDEACAHPNWVMGRKISVDSATMMNKALEVIEARWLFDLRARADQGGHPPAKHHPFDGRVSRRLRAGAAGHARHARSDQLWAVLSAAHRLRRGAAGLRRAVGVDLRGGRRAAFPRAAPVVGRAARPRRQQRGAERSQRGGRGRIPRAAHRLRRNPRAQRRHHRGRVCPARTMQRRWTICLRWTSVPAPTRGSGCRSARDDHHRARLPGDAGRPDRHPRVRPLSRGGGLRREGAALLGWLRPRAVAAPARTRRHRVRDLRAAAGRLCAHARRARGAGACARDASRLQPPALVAPRRHRRCRTRGQPAAGGAAVRCRAMDRHRRAQGRAQCTGGRQPGRAGRPALGRLGARHLARRRGLVRRALDERSALADHPGRARRRGAAVVARHCAAACLVAHRDAGACATGHARCRRHADASGGPGRALQRAGDGRGQGRRSRGEGRPARR